MTIQSKLITAILIFGFTIGILTAEDNLFRERANNLSNDEKIVRDIIETQYPGYVNSSDTKGYASQFTEDALWMPPGEVNRRGPEEIYKKINEEIKTVHLSPVVTIKELSVFGDHAYVIARDSLTIIPKEGGDELHIVYTVFWFLRKENNQWKIARQIWNEKPIAE